MLGQLSLCGIRTSLVVNLVVVPIKMSRSGFDAHRGPSFSRCVTLFADKISKLLVKFTLQRNSASFLFCICFDACFDLRFETIYCGHELFVFKDLSFADCFDPGAHDAGFVWPESLGLIEEVRLKCKAGLSFKTLTRIEVRHASDGVILRFQNGSDFFSIVLAAPSLRGKGAQEDMVVVESFSL